MALCLVNPNSRWTLLHSGQHKMSVVAVCLFFGFVCFLFCFVCFIWCFCFVFLVFVFCFVFCLFVFGVFLYFL